MKKCYKLPIIKHIFFLILYPLVKSTITSDKSYQREPNVFVLGSNRITYVKILTPDGLNRHLSDHSSCNIIYISIKLRPAIHFVGTMINESLVELKTY